MQHHGDLAGGLFARDNAGDVLLDDGLGGRLSVLTLPGADIEVVTGRQQGAEAVVGPHGLFDLSCLHKAALQSVLEGVCQRGVRRENDGGLRCVGRISSLARVIRATAAETACQHRDSHGG